MREEPNEFTSVDEARLGPIRAIVGYDEKESWYVVVASDTGIIPYRGVFWQISASDFRGKDSTVLMLWHYALEEPARQHFEALTHRWDEATPISTEEFDDYMASVTALSDVARRNTKKNPEESTNIGL